MGAKLLVGGKNFSFGPSREGGKLQNWRLSCGRLTEEFLRLEIGRIPFYWLKSALNGRILPLRAQNSDFRVHPCEWINWSNRQKRRSARRIWVTSASGSRGVVRNKVPNFDTVCPLAFPVPICFPSPDCKTKVRSVYTVNGGILKPKVS